MKQSLLIIAISAVLSLFLLSGCKDGDGIIETKEPMKQLSEMPEGKRWSVTDGFPDAED